MHQNILGRKERKKSLTFFQHDENIIKLYVYNCLVCGIIGGKGTNISEFIHRNLDLLGRRGPDSKGINSLENGIVIGATRLSMVDPHPRSDQPMIDSITGNIIAFNGEIFNYLKLRNDLQKNGICFNTKSDTEVLLKGLTFYGKDFIPRLQGMFSFIFFNKSKNTLILSRDYLGKKPLYYSLVESKFLACSSSSLIHKFLTTSSIDLNSITKYLKFGYLVDPDTMYKEIRSVPPGQIMSFNCSDNIFIDSDSFIPSVFKLKTATKELKDDVELAIKERVVGHNKFALSLSGGLDSTILAIECSRLKIPFTAYSMRWLDSGKDKLNIDSDNAKRVAEKLGVDFQFVDMPTVDQIPNVLDEYLNAMEEPNSNPSGLSMMALYAKMNSDGHRLLITGDGSDEIFGGYSRYKIAKKLNFLPEIHNEISSEIMDKKIANSRFGTKIFISLLSKNSLDYWAYWHELISNNMLKSIFPDLNFNNFYTYGLELSDLYESNKVSVLMFQDLRTWLTMESNRKLDRLSMWFSMEARSPFESENVIASGYNEMSKSRFDINNKKLLRNLYPELDYMPINLSKLGFISPLGYWMRNNPNLLKDTVRQLGSFIPIETSRLKPILDSPTRGNFREFRFLWNLIVLNRWFLTQ